MHEPIRPAAPEKRPSEKPAPDKQSPEQPSREKSKPDARPADKLPAGSGLPETRLSRKPWRPLIAVVLLAAIATGIFLWYRHEHPLQNPNQLELQGNIDVRQVNLAFKVEGRIATLEVDEGDAATAGQILATLDKRYFEDDLRLVRAQRDNAQATLEKLEHGSRPEEIAEAKAQVAEAKATLERAHQDFDRSDRLVNKGAVSREEYDRNKAALDESEARLKYAQQALQLAEIGPRQEDIAAARADLAAREASVVQSERRLADSELIAPNDGTILTRAREKGAIVSPGETVFTLTLTSPVWVRTYVNEHDLGRIEPGMAAQVRTDSKPDKLYRAHIGFISPTAEFTPKTVETRELRTDLVYRLRVVVDNADGGLRQGMPVTVLVDLHPPKSDERR